MKKTTKQNAYVFDVLMSELMSDVGSNDMLAESMTLNPERIERIPLRYRIIALGFLQNMSLSELNNQLKENNCTELYSRSLWEASLIYAFKHGLSYQEWNRLRDICFEFQEEQDIHDPYFTGSSISVQDIRNYLEENSVKDNSALMTQHRTGLVLKVLQDAPNEEEEFRSLLELLVHDLTPVHEKARYYFCKYLYYMLLTKASEYAASLEAEVGADAAFSDILHFFKGVTPLKRKKYTPEEAKAFLMKADISPGGIFDAFNEYFFDYVSSDWMDVLLDFYGSVDSIPAADIKNVANHLRNYNPDVYGNLSDEEALTKLQDEEKMREEEMDAIYSDDENSSRGYQRNRVGENTIRKYIKGALDIDRTTLICFLLFFGGNSDLAEEDAITQERLSKILKECGFRELTDEDDFDYFAIQFLEADDPVDYLMEEATWYAKREENFYLYRVYKGSYKYFDFYS